MINMEKLENNYPIKEIFENKKLKQNKIPLNYNEKIAKQENINEEQENYNNKMNNIKSKIMKVNIPKVEIIIDKVDQNDNKEQKTINNENNKNEEQNFKKDKENLHKNIIKWNTITQYNIIDEKEKEENIDLKQLNQTMENKIIQDSINNKNMIISKRKIKSNDINDKNNIISDFKKEIKVGNIKRIKPKFVKSTTNTSVHTKPKTYNNHNLDKKSKKNSINKTDKIDKSTENNLKNNINQDKDYKKIEGNNVLYKSLDQNYFQKIKEMFPQKKEISNSQIIPIPQQKSETYFNPNDFKILEVLGEGEYGKIYLVQWVYNNNQYYAMKKEIFTNEEELKKSQNITKIVKDFLKNTNSLGVIKIYGDMCQKINNTYNYYVLMERSERDMEQELIIRCNNNYQFYTETDLINVLCQLILVLAELQKNNIAHRDIKPQNILIIEGRYKLSDFGEAIIIKNNSPIIQEIRGTELYMSPILFFGLRQKLQQVQHNVYKSDVFSLGLCILLAATFNYDSLVAIRELTDMNQIQNLLMYYLSGRYSWNVISFLMRMLEVDENKRPDFIQLESMLVKKQ